MVTDNAVGPMCRVPVCCLQFQLVIGSAVTLSNTSRRFTAAKCSFLLRSLVLTKVPLTVSPALFKDINPSSAVRKTVVLICRGLCNLDPGFLHYILDCMLNDSVLLGQVQPQSLQQFSHQPLRSRHGA